MFVCEQCGNEFESKRKFICHINKIHNLNLERYALRFEHNNITPKCKCGCGIETSWNRHKSNFNIFIHSHQTRDPDVLQKMIIGGKSVIGDKRISKLHSENAKRLWSVNDYRLKHHQTRSNKNSSWHIKRQQSLSFYRKEILPKESSIRLKNRWKQNGVQLRLLMSSKSFKQKVSIATKKALSCPRKRKKISLNASRNQILGIIGPNRSKRSWVHNPFTNQQEFFHSSWEVQFLNQAIIRNIPIKRNTTLILEYFDVNLKTHHYTPDFLSLSENTIIEIKGLMNEIDLIKFVAASTYAFKTGKKFLVIDSLNMISSNEIWDQIS